MKKVVFILLLMVFAMSCVMQTYAATDPTLTIKKSEIPITYAQRKIAYWTFEKMPMHYIAVTHHSTVEKNIYGKLVAYTQYDEFGKISGIQMEMSADGLFPSIMRYYYKGKIVYMCYYFSNSWKVAGVSNSSWKYEYELEGYNFMYMEFDGVMTKIVNIYGTGEDASTIVKKYCNGVEVPLDKI